MANYRIESLQKRAEARRLHEAGLPLIEIAARLNRSRSCILEYIRGTDNPKPRGHRYEGQKGDDTKRLVLECYERGVPLLETARLAGVCKSTVSRWLNAYVLGPEEAAA